MAWIESEPVTFGKMFGLFQLYWNYCLQRGQQLNPFEVLILTNATYIKLKDEWTKQNITLRIN